MVAHYLAESIAQSLNWQNLWQALYQSSSYMFLKSLLAFSSGRLQRGCFTAVTLCVKTTGMSLLKSIKFYKYQSVIFYFPLFYRDEQLRTLYDTLNELFLLLLVTSTKRKMSQVREKMLQTNLGEVTLGLLQSPLG